MADIDGKILDWRYHMMPDERVWQKKVDGACYKLRALRSGTLELTKDTGTGRIKNLLKECDSVACDDGVRRILESH